jgi:AcrR family transcriptional regulator
VPLRGEGPSGRPESVSTRRDSSGSAKTVEREIAEVVRIAEPIFSPQADAELSKEVWAVSQLLEENGTDHAKPTPPAPPRTISRPNKPAPMYRRLPHGPNGMSREAVARNQRARMYGGMIEAVHEGGYEQTTVKQVVALAGVSGGAFYDQFANKEAAFLATYDIVVARARKLVLDAWAQERGWGNRMRGAFKALLDDIAEQPKGPHLVLVDSLGIGPKALERMRLASTTFERIVQIAFQTDPHGEDLSPLTVRAIVAGVRHVAFRRMYEHREKELYTLTDELLGWIDSYRSPVAKRLDVLPRPQVKQITPQPAAFLESGDQRSRVLGALVHLTLDDGYSELRDAQIAQLASISLKEFHEIFPSKEACFLAVLDEFVAEAMETVKRSIVSASGWPEAVHLAVGALVEYFASHESVTRLAFIEIFDVGPGVIGRMTQLIEDFTQLLDTSGPEVQRGSVVAREAITGAIWGIVLSYVAQDRVSQLPSVIDRLTFLVLAPYIGPVSAMDTIEAARQQSP